MNSEVITFKLDEPRTWIEFHQMPDGLKAEYLNHLYSKYNPTQAMLAQMFDVTASAVSIMIKRKKLPAPECTRKRTFDEIAAWERFLGPKTVVLDGEPCGHPDPVGDPGEPGVPKAPDATEAHKITPVDPKFVTIAFDGSVEDVLVAIRRLFAGNPKLQLTVTWEVKDV